MTDRASSPDRHSTTNGIWRLRRVPFVVSCLLVALAFPTQGQRKKDRIPQIPAVDPYTQGDPELTAAAGYLSFGPFPFGDGFDTQAVEEALGGIRVYWVETAHFRIGSTLGAYDLPRKSRNDFWNEREKIEAELLELQKKLPAVPTEKVKELDPWLRLHLFAQRLEGLYDSFQGRLGSDDSWFPGGEKQTPHPGGVDMGSGPYLGQKGKYTVLLLQRESSLSRFCQTFLRQVGVSSMRHHHVETGSLFFLMCEELMEGDYKRDIALHCYLVFNVVQNLINGFREYRHEVPMWWREGVGHVFAAEVDERFRTYVGSAGREGVDPEFWDWEPKVYARVTHDYYPSSEKMFEWSDPAKLKYEDHQILWSRVQFLMQVKERGFRDFMMAYKAPLRAPMTESDHPDMPKFLHHRQLAAVKKAWDFLPETLDEEWAKWVLENYRSKVSKR